MITFESIGLSPAILKAIGELGFDKPTPVQEQTIPHLLENDGDIVALAQTGTGKTAAFGLPILQQTDINLKGVQCIVLCPTRELCLQITRDFEKYSKYQQQLNVVAIYGGDPIEKQMRALRKGAHIVVGTPGRVMDMMRRRALDLSTIRWLVLDEADEMLNMGFKEDLDTILSETPDGRQTLLFSATMPKEISIIAKKYMKDAHEISVGHKNTSTDTVHHVYYAVHASDKYHALKRIADIHPSIYGIIFCRTRKETQEVAAKLMNDGYNADSLHGDLSQAQRDTVMSKFRIKNLQLLVATDVAARGLDVSDLTHVINYTLPDDSEVYVHRSGRTGRAGKKGTSISIINMRESGRIRDFEKKITKQFERRQVPNGAEICEKQLFNLVDKMEKVEVNEQHIESFLPAVYKKLEVLSREDLIKRFVSVEFNRFLTYYKNAPDLNVELSSRGSRDQRDQRDSGDRRKSERRQRTDDNNFSRFFMNKGKKDNLNTARLIGMINDQTKTRDISIGKIEIMDNFSFFEVDASWAERVMNSFTNVNMNGSQVMIEPSQPKDGGGSGSGGGGGRQRSDRGGYNRDSGGDRGGYRGGSSGSGGGYKGRSSGTSRDEGKGYDRDKKKSYSKSSADKAKSNKVRKNKKFHD